MQRTAKTTTHVKPRRSSSSQKKKAASLFAEWAKDNVPIEFIDSMSGLRYPGRLADTSSSGVTSFEFLGQGGVTTNLLPSDWTEISIIAIAGLALVEVREDGGRKYDIRKGLGHQADVEEVGSANARMESWCVAKTLLYFHLEHAFCSFSFLGTIVNSRDGFWLVQPQNGGGVLGITMENLICQVQTASLNLLDASTRTQLQISETGTKLIERFESWDLLKPVVH